MSLLQPKLKRRMWIPGILLFVLSLGMVWVFVRGNWSPTLADPTRSSEGTRCGYEELTDGGKLVRCVFVVDYPMNRVKAVITDYDHFAQKLPFLSASHGIPEGLNHVRFIGVAHYTSHDAWPFEILIEHYQDLSEFTASWDASSKDLARNRGNWTLRRLDAKHTQVSYALEIKVKYIPTFIVRNILLDQIPQVADATKKWIETLPKEPTETK